MAGPTSSAVRLSDGAFDFSFGCDSSRVTTVASQTTPQGLPRNALAWLDNCTVRGGGITQRNGWTKLFTALAQGNGNYQGGFLYTPINNTGLPYLMLSVGGKIYKCLLDGSNSVVNLSQQFNLFNPAGPTQVWMTQGEQFLVIQAGDYGTTNTLPLFWDGAILRRSNGINSASGSVMYNLFSPIAWTIPNVGSSVVVPLLGSANDYPGSNLDTVNVQMGAVLEGQFTVTAITNTSVANYNTTVSSSGNIAVPNPGGSMTFPIVGTYSGNVNDLIYIYGGGPQGGGGGFFGVWKVTAKPPGSITIQCVGNCPDSGFTIFFPLGYPLFLYGQSSVTLQTISSNLIGGTASAGTYNYTVVTNATPINELPAAGPMVYYQGRIWYAQGNQVSAGDIVAGPSGTSAYQFHDSILKVTENPLALGGDGFNVPTNAGNITALSYNANLNTALGQGPLVIFTRTQVYNLTVPVTRNDWISTNNNNAPLMVPAQIRYGAVGDRSVVPVNGDLFYMTPETAIRSLFVSQRYFGQWANVPISNNEQRVLRFNNRMLMATCPGIEFDNRLLMGVLPTQTPVGVAFQGVVPLDFHLISTLQAQLPPAWEGMWEGLNVLQMFSGDFNGLQRGIIVNWSDPNKGGDGGIDVWEITGDSAPAQRDNVDSRVTWYFETPAWTFSDEFSLKELDWLQMWVDRVAGEIDMKFEYRPDADSCWRLWAETSFCSARSTCEDVFNPICYPVQQYCEGQRFPIGLPKPPALDCVTGNQRPPNIGYQFQVRVTITGFCRIRGKILKALPRNEETFANLNCNTTKDTCQ